MRDELKAFFHPSIPANADETTFLMSWSLVRIQPYRKMRSSVRKSAKCFTKTLSPFQTRGANAEQDYINKLKPILFNCNQLFQSYLEKMEDGKSFLDSSSAQRRKI
jgi:hypothetical protein